MSHTAITAGLSTLHQAARVLEAQAVRLRETADQENAMLTQHGDEYVKSRLMVTNVRRAAENTTLDLARATALMFDALVDVTKEET